MRKKLLLTVAALTMAASSQAQMYQAQRDTVYARNVCIEDMTNNYVSNTDRPEYDKKGNLKKKPVVSVSDYDTQWQYWTTWPTATRTLAYYVHLPQGHVRADMVITTRAGRQAVIHAKLSDPVEKTTLRSWDIQADQPGQQQTVECLADIEIEKDGWYRLEFLCDNGSTDLGRFDYIVFQRTSKDAICTPRIYSALATYLNSWRTTDTEAPTGASYDCVYLEVKAPEDYESINSYISTMNLLGGYLGIQSCLNTGADALPRNYFKNFWHNVIFSMWDNGDVDKTPYLPEYLRSGGFDKDENVVFNRFGNEGTGIQAMKGNGDWWHPGKWVQMLFTCRPEDITVTVEDDNGNPVTFVYHNTLVSLWYKMEDQDNWIYQATLRKSGLGNYVDTWGAFLENWSPTAGQYERRALFRNCYLHSIASNKWYNCNRTTSGYYYDPNRLRADMRDRRLDMGFGITPEDPNVFYMSAGGFFTVSDGVNRAYTTPLAEDHLCVDTINLANMQRRVDQAVRYYNRNTVIPGKMEENTGAAGLTKIVEELIAGADQFNGYRSEDLDDVIKTFNDGNFNQRNMRQAIYELAESHSPLLYSSVQRMENIGTYRAYQLYQPDGYGIVAGKVDENGAQTLRTACSNVLRGTDEAKEVLPVTDLMANWVIIRPDKGTDYYLYNIGLEKFLDLSRSNFLGEHAKPVTVTKVNNGFTFTQDSYYLSIAPTSRTGATVSKARSQGTNAIFELRDNVTMQPSDEYINKIIDKTVESAKYIALANEINSQLELPEGVVGYIVNEADREQLRQAIDNETLSYDQLSQLFNNAERVPFEPETTLYRIRSASHTYLQKPYLTLTDGLMLNMAAANEALYSQVWTLRANGEGYSLYSQNKAISLISTNASQPVLAGDEPIVVYIEDQGGCHFGLKGRKESTYGITAGNSNLIAGTLASVNAQWYLEPVETVSVTFDETAVADYCADFNLLLPDNGSVVAYAAREVKADGEVELAALNGTMIAAGTAVLLNGPANTTVHMAAVPATKEATTETEAIAAEAKDIVAETAGNLFGGTYLKLTTQRNQYFILDTNDQGQPIMKPNTMTNLDANSIYIAITLVPEGLTELTFSNDFLGISSPQTATDADTTTPVYDLQGRKIGNTARGIVIQNGRKVIGTR